MVAAHIIRLTLEEAPWRRAAGETEAGGPESLPRVVVLTGNTTCTTAGCTALDKALLRSRSHFLLTETLLFQDVETEAQRGPSGTSIWATCGDSGVRGRGLPLAPLGGGRNVHRASGRAGQGLASAHTEMLSSLCGSGLSRKLDWRERL